MPIVWNNALRARVEAAAFRGVVRGTNRVRREVIRLIRRTAKTGRIYRRRGVEHQASAPGEPPAVDRGIHVRGISAEYDRETLSGFVNSSAAYGRALEYGTATMEARPHMRPAVESQARGVTIDIAFEVGKVLRS